MIILSIMLLFLVGIVLYLIKRNVFLIIPVFLALVIVISFRLTYGYFPIPNGMRHLLHLINPPNDLYKLVIEDKFLFFEKGYSKEYLFNPKYLNFYDLGFFVADNLPENYKYEGKLKIEFYSKGELFLEKVITSWTTMRKKQVSLFHFEVPIKGKYFKDIKIKLTVLEPDLQLSNYKDSLEIFIGVSSTP